MHRTAHSALLPLFAVLFLNACTSDAPAASSNPQANTPMVTLREDAPASPPPAEPEPVDPASWTNAGPVLFDAQGVFLSIATEQIPASRAIRYWTDNAAACGPDRPAGYWEQFADTYKEGEWTTYLLLQGRTLVATITTVPNGMGYDAFETFQEDFFACDVGVPQPVAMNDQWLVLGLRADDSALADSIITSIRLQ